MPHLDEGTIHAWLDEALSGEEARDVATHVATCPECAARVAEARGLIAAASRILTALDDVPGQVIPSRSHQSTSADMLQAARARRAQAQSSRPWWKTPRLLSAAAVVVVAVGTATVLSGGWPIPGRDRGVISEATPTAVRASFDSSSGATRSAESKEPSPAALRAPAPPAPTAAANQPAPPTAEPSRGEMRPSVAENKERVEAPKVDQLPARERIAAARADNEDRSRQAGADSVVRRRARAAEATVAGATQQAAGVRQERDVRAPSAAPLLAAKVAAPLAGCYALRLITPGDGPSTVVAPQFPSHIALDSTPASGRTDGALVARDISPEKDRVEATFLWKRTTTQSFELVILRDGGEQSLQASIGQATVDSQSAPGAGRGMQLLATREACPPSR